MNIFIIKFTFFKKLVKRYFLNFFQKDLTSSLLLKIIESLILIVITAQISRLLGPQEFGKYNYLLSIVLLLDPLKKMGTFGILQSELSRDKKNKTILNDLFFVRVILSS